MCVLYIFIAASERVWSILPSPSAERLRDKSARGRLNAPQTHTAQTLREFRPCECESGPAGPRDALGFERGDKMTVMMLISGSEHRKRRILTDIYCTIAFNALIYPSFWSVCKMLNMNTIQTTPHIYIFITYLWPYGVLSYYKLLCH